VEIGIQWGLGLFHPLAALVGGSFGPGRPLFCTWSPIGRSGSGSAGNNLGCCWGGLPFSTMEGRGPLPGSGGWLPLWGIGTWTWEYRVCMGSVSECTTSIDVCLYIGCVAVSVFMCMHEGGNV
ncbi:hypothetical protein ILYODFUR_023405, partial [Ilyodon furcidens]